MSAKFIAQIEISKPCVSSESSSGGGDEAEDRQHQRQPRGDERAECEHEDRERDRPAEQLRLHHRRAVRGVEVAPHAGSAGERDGDAGCRRRACSFAFSLSATATIAVGSPFAPAITIAVWPSAEIVDPGRGATTVATFGFVRSSCSTRETVGRKAGSVAVRLRRVDDDHQRRAREPAEVSLDQLSRLHRLRAVRLPPRSGERGLDLRREEAEPDRDDDPGDRHGAEVIGGPAAEPADRTDCLGVLGREDPGAERRRDGGHEPTAPISSLSAASCRSREPQTSSQRANTPSSTIA